MNIWSAIPAGAAIALAIILAVAGIAKLRSRAGAARAIARYAPAVAAHAPLIVVPLALLELGSGLALVLPGTRAEAAIVASLLLLFYVAAIALAIVRGEAGEDCGCGGVAGIVPIGMGLLARNCALLAVSIMLARMPQPAPRTPADWLAVAVVCACALLAWLAANFLLARERLLNDD